VILTLDKSVIIDGIYKYLSVEKFKNEICKGEVCFICGAKESEKEFNNEHILPDWILRKFNLHSKSIALPNLARFKYYNYKIPCCKECNSLLGKEVENPISQLFSQDYTFLTEHVKFNGIRTIFVWLSLIYIKSHLKDNFLRIDRDFRSSDLKIGELYDWETMHHIHCVARSFYTKCNISQDAFGTIVILPAKVLSYYSNFDYCDTYDGKAVLLRMNDICIIAILNDSCGSLSLYGKELCRLTSPLSPLQCREVFANLILINQKIRKNQLIIRHLKIQINLQ